MTLPQNHGWQVVLRNYLASLQLQDFDCGLPGLSFSADYFASGDDVYRAWITFENLGRNIVRGNRGVRMDSCNFLLENIEREDGIYGKLYASYEPAELAWLYSWNYAGNPYYDNLQVANRALAACMWDMILTHDKFIDGMLQGIDQAVSSAFATYAYTLSTCINVLDSDVVDAYLEGLKSFFDVLEAQGAGSDQADLSLSSIVGMWYTAQHVSGLDERCEAYARAFMDASFSEAGYIKHGNAFDPSYNGISIKYLTWAALVTGYDFLAEALDKMCKLKSYLTLTDSGKVYGPSSFSTSTSFGSPQDQHATFGRDLAASYVSGDADYLRYGYRNSPDWNPHYQLKDVAGMLSDILSWTNRANTQEPNQSFGTWTRTSTFEPEVWSKSHHLAIPSVEWDYYPAIYHETVQHEGEAPPFAREGDFIENFNDEFVAWKIGGMGGVLHLGGLSWWPPHNGVGLSGLSGGSLCALWTKKGGISVLGRNRGFAGPTPDTMANMESWNAQHVWGVKDDEYHSTARCKNPNTSIIIDGAENAMITCVGDLTESNPYHRGIDINSKGVQVRVSTLLPHGFTELYESIPLWLGDGYDNAPATDADEYPPIHYRAGGLWRVMSRDEYFEAEAVKVERNGHATLYEFGRVERVHLGTVWTSEYQIRKERAIPLHVDILERGTVRYTISGPYEHELRKAA